ncbi:VOC family protein [Nonomuraea jabiensis]|uniref:Putative enzyme related to lactoylglutathione lyase n=1 Tax=Nonomuraea jabiensis TaxID=882448 RepID=A0A7W9GD41_9ACTN|nr:VOC family protein [Nonomuraea jabiensis]MBB5781552.1 putative enzyme related to lactoylglutathione lyase [Nonomuraea jabiensis]
MAHGRRFAFTKLLVGDLEAEVAFYSAVLGLVIKHRVSAGEGAEVILCATGHEEPSLVLLHRPHQARPEPGEAVLGFVVEDVEHAVRAAEGAGGVVRVAPKAVPQAGVTVAQVEDPDGHLVELLQHQ